MRDEYLALEIAKIYYSNHRGYQIKEYLDNYFEILEGIELYKSKNTLGEVKQLLEAYRRKTSRCDFDSIRLIENVESILKNE